MERKTIITDAVIAQFNAFSDNIRGKEFKREEMKKQLEQKMGWKMWDGLFMALTSGINPPIIRIKRGIYTVNPKPVYKERLQTCFSELKKANDRYQSNRDKSSLDEQIQCAINLLKNNGYKVYKSIIKFEEV